MQGNNLSDILFNISISVFGGLVKLLTSKTKHKSFSKYVSSALVGGFAGLLTYFLSKSLKASPEIIGFASGVAGYMGDSILELFTNILVGLVKNKFKIVIDENDDTNDKDNKDKS